MSQTIDELTDQSEDFSIALQKEITNEEILLYLDNTKFPTDEIKNCFKLSSLVEFAKHQENENEFYHMMDVENKIIRA